MKPASTLPASARSRLRRGRDPADRPDAESVERSAIDDLPAPRTQLGGEQRPKWPALIAKLISGGAEAAAARCAATPELRWGRRKRRYRRIEQARRGFTAVGGR